MNLRSKYMLGGGVALLLLVAGGLAVGGGLGAHSAADHMKRGVAALDAGDPRTARIELMNAIKADPKSGAAHLTQAKVMVALGDGVSAANEVQRAAALGVSKAELNAWSADAMVLQGNAQGALKLLDSSDVTEAEAGHAARVRGKALAMLGQVDQAGAAFARAAELSKQDSSLWIDIGNFRQDAGDAAGALSAADQAISVGPDNVRALTLRARLVRSQYGLTASLPWFDKAMQVDDNDPGLLNEYGATLADLGQARRAVALTRRSISVQPDNPRAFFIQALIAARAGDSTLARSLMARTGGALNGQPAVMLLNGVLQLDDGNAGLAADGLRDLVTLQPRNEEARLLFGRALAESGQYDEAADALAPLLGSDADSYVLALAARVQEALGNQGAAEDLLARASRPWPQPSAVFAGNDNLGALAAAADKAPGQAGPNIDYIRALLRAGQAGEAVRRAARLRDANPGAPDAYIVYGDALSAAGRDGDAAQAYARAANVRFSEDVALRLVSAWQRAGQANRALQVVSLFLEQNPQSIAVNRMAARVRMDLGDWQGALDALSLIEAKTGRQDALLMADMAWALSKLGKNDKALAYAAYAYRLQPASPVTADVLGWQLLQTGKDKQAAVDLLEKAVALTPDNPLLNYHLGTAYAASGRKDDARRVLALAANDAGFSGRGEAKAMLARL